MLNATRKYGLLLLCMQLLWLVASAKKIPIFTQSKNCDNLAVDSFLIVHDDLLSSIPQSDTNWYSGYDIFSVKARAILAVKSDNSSCLPDTFSCRISVRLKFWEHANHLDSLDTILFVNYDKQNGHAYNEKAIYELTGIHYLTITILSISNTGVKNFLYLEGQVEEERFVRNFNISSQPAVKSVQLVSNNEIEVTIDTVLFKQAEEYDLEWIYLDGYKKDMSLKSTSEQWYDFRNNTSRVTITSTTYRISNVFEMGYVLFRVRTVGKGGADYSHRITGEWSSNHLLGALSGESSNAYVAITSDHQSTLNWQFYAAYAEEGKKKEVVSYFDGSFRKRQTVSKNNSNNMAVVQEVIYDYAGRPAIEVLPVPAFSSSLGYFQNFNRNSVDYPYTRADFDLDPDACAASTDSMKVTKGASRYYSSQNDSISLHAGTNALIPNFNNYIPVASGFPFVQTEFMPDNTGRVRRKSGVGIDHQLGTNHETFYYYATPFQEELDRLFGNEVGYFKHYKKNMVKDPNGQISVSYLDTKGHIIATALAGPSPGNVSSLSSNVTRNGVIVDLTSSDDTSYTADGVVVTKTFIVDHTDEYGFYYSLNPQSYTPSCRNSGVCYDCVYDLQITLLDQCGNPKLKGSGDTLMDIKRVLGSPLSSLDTTCSSGSNAYSFTYDSRLDLGTTSHPTDTFLVAVLDPGTYTIIKSLRVDTIAMNFYINDFIKHQNCKTLTQFQQDAWAAMDTSGCEMTCATCHLNLGSQSDYLTKYMSMLIAQGYTPRGADTNQVIHEYYKQYKQCDQLCDTPGICKAFLEILKHDVAPGGQYAKYYIDEDRVFQPDGNTDYNVLSSSSTIGKYTSVDAFKYDSVLIGGVKTSFHDLSLEDFILNWRDTFADYLVQYHPEYCQYVWCNANQSSYQFDYDMQNTDSYDTALAKGFLNPLDSVSFTNVIDPFFKSTGTGAYATWYVDDMMRHYKTLWKHDVDSPSHDSAGFIFSMWDMPVLAIFCVNQTDTMQVKNCVAEHRDSISSCRSFKQEFWYMFRAMYYSEKTHILDSMRAIWTYPSSGGSYCTGSRVPSGYTVRFKDVGSIIPSDLITAKADIQNQVVLKCDSQCSAYADYWMEKISGCSMLDYYDKQAIRDSLIEVCKFGCDITHPMGSSSVAPQYLSMSGIKYKSFNDVLRNLFKDRHPSYPDTFFKKGVCDDILITMPQPYNHDYFATESPYADTCACNQTQYNNLTSTCGDTVTVTNNKCPCTDIKSKSKDVDMVLKMSAGNDAQYKCKRCIDCEQMAAAYQIFYNKYDTVKEYTTHFFDIFESFMNSYNSFNLSASEYIKFMMNCVNAGSEDTNLLRIYRSIYQVTKHTTAMNFSPIPYLPAGYPIPEQIIIASVPHHVSIQAVITTDRELQLQKADDSSDEADALQQMLGNKILSNNKYPFLKQLDNERINSDEPIVLASTQTDVKEIFAHHRRFPGLTRSRLVPLKFNKISRVMDEGGANGHFDNCGCDEILDAQKTFNAGGSGYPSAVALYFHLYNYDVTDEDILSEFDEMELVCCKAANGLSVSNAAALLADIKNGLSEPCVIPEGWVKGTWDGGKMAALNTSEGSGSNSDLILPPFKDCPPVSMSAPDHCACDSIMKTQKAFQSDSLAGHTGDSTFKQYFAAHTGLSIANIDTILWMCEAAWQSDLLKGNWGPDSTWSSTQETNLSQYPYLFDPPLVVPSSLICTPAIDSFPFPSGTARWLLTCNDISAWLVDSFLAYIAPAYSTIPEALATSAGRLALTNYLKHVFGGTIFDTSAIDTESVAMVFERCNCIYAPIWYQCWYPPPTPIHPIYIPAESTCSNCYLPDERLLYLQQYLNDLTQPLITLPLYNITKLTSNGWSMFPGITSYFNTSLYDGSHDSDLTYYLRAYSPKYLTMEMNDAHGNVKRVHLNIPYAHPMYNLPSIIGFYGIRLADASGGCNMVYFTINAVFKRMKAYCSKTYPRYDTIVITGYVENIPIADLVTCRTNCLMLCNKPIEQLTDSIDLSPCKKMLKRISSINAQNAYNRYLDSLTRSCKTTYVQRCIQAYKNEKFVMRYNDNQYHYTLYYYDQVGNLVKTVPPAGVNPITDTASLRQVRDKRKSNDATIITPSHSLATYYLYNTLNQLIWQQTPDAGVSIFYYDAMGRLVVSSNAKQSSRNNYSYTLYDGLGRITEVGEINTTSTMSYSVSHNSSSLASWVSGGSRTQITRTYYDGALSGILVAQDNLRGRVATTTFRKYDASGYDHAVHYSYDMEGNVKTLVREIPSLSVIDESYKQIDYDFDLVSGKVNTVTYQSGEVDQYIHQYAYDADNRIIEVQSGISVQLLERDAAYFYYMHGPLARAELGANHVQGIDYAYTIHGWLKGVNSGALSPQRDIGRDGDRYLSGNMYTCFAHDVFGFTLGYYQGDYISAQPLTTASQFEAATSGSVAGSNSPNLYNGNIRMMVTAIAKFMQNGAMPMAYGYHYDQLNRLMQMDAYANFDSANNQWSASGTALVDYHNRFTYDANGNILTQVRRGSAAVHLALDSLNYDYYPNSNRLKRVLDGVSSSNYTDDIDNQNDSNYAYDEIGNLIKDKAEEIDSIQWNVYGKITRIKRTGGSLRPDLEFEYTPEGHRALKVVIPKNGNGLKIYTYYVRDAQGNIMATYNRHFNKIINYDSITFAGINDTLIQTTGTGGFGDFIKYLHGTRFVNSSFDDNLETRIDSTTARIDTFLYNSNPTDMLTGNSTLYLNTIAIYDSVSYITALISSALNKQDFIHNICNCMTTLHGSDPSNPTFLEWIVTDAGALEYFIRQLFRIDFTNLGSLMTALGHPTGDVEDAVSYVLAFTDLTGLQNSIIGIGYDNCDNLAILFAGLYHDNPSQFIPIFARIPRLKDMTSTSDICGILTSSQVIDALVSYNKTYLWNTMITANGNATDFIYWFKTNALSSYLKTIAIKDKYFISDYQQTHSLYTMEQYFGYIKDNYGQVTYDNILMKYINASRTYMDSFNINEWNIYGSARIGIYHAYMNLVTHEFCGDTTGGSFTNTVNINYTYSQTSYDYFILKRGNKHYELVNHLGNILVVVSDKKLQTCNADTNTYYLADVLQATDYSAFGAPLPSRTYYSDTTNQYRFGFNGQESDNQIKGDGNSYSFDFRMYDTRICKFLSVDPLTTKYPELTPYQFASNTPIWARELEGLEANYTSDGKTTSDVFGEGSNNEVSGPITPEYAKELGYKYTGITDANPIIIQIDGKHSFILTGSGKVDYELKQYVGSLTFGQNMPGLGAENDISLFFIGQSNGQYGWIQTISTNVSVNDLQVAENDPKSWVDRTDPYNWQMKTYLKKDCQYTDPYEQGDPAHLYNVGNLFWDNNGRPANTNGAVFWNAELSLVRKEQDGYKPILNLKYGFSDYVKGKDPKFNPLQINYFPSQYHSTVINHLPK